MQHINELLLYLPPNLFFSLLAVRLYRIFSITFRYFGYPLDKISRLFYTLNQRCVRRNNNISQ
jgi:hypothetical protein